MFIHSHPDSESQRNEGRETNQHNVESVEIARRAGFAHTRQSSATPPHLAVGAHRAKGGRAAEQSPILFFRIPGTAKIEEGLE